MAMWNSGSAKGTTSPALRECQVRVMMPSTWPGLNAATISFRFLTTPPPTAVLAGLLPLFPFFRLSARR